MTNLNHSIKNKFGFTMIEILTGMLIVGTITATTTPLLIQKFKDNESVKVAAEVDNILLASQNYFTANNQWPNEVNNCDTGLAISTLKSKGYLPAVFDSTRLQLSNGMKYKLNCALIPPATERQLSLNIAPNAKKGTYTADVVQMASSHLPLTNPATASPSTLKPSLTAYALTPKEAIIKSGYIAKDENIHLPDNKTISFGDSDDLKIYHDGGNSIIKDTGVGGLEFNTNGPEVQINGNNGTEYMLRAISNGSVKSYFDNAVRLETTSTGIDVTGGVTVSGGSVFGSYVDFKSGGAVKGNIATDASTMIINTQGTNTTFNTNGGNVGIGTDNPLDKLDVNGNMYLRAGQIQTPSGVVMTLDSGGTSTRIRTNGSEAMRITSNGGVSVGTTVTAGSGGLLVDNDIKTNSRFGVGSGGNASDAAIYKVSDSDTGIYWPTTNTLGLTTGGSERMRITPTGNIGINTTSPSEKLHVNGNILASGNVTAYSDKNLKYNIKEISSPLNSLSNIKGVTYKWKNTGNKDIGVIAQDIEKTFPELVKTHDNNIKSVNYNGLVGVLVSSVNELNANNKVQQAQINLLMNRVKMLESK